MEQTNDDTAVFGTAGVAVTLDLLDNNESCKGDDRSIDPCLHTEWSSCVILFGVPRDLTKKNTQCSYGTKDNKPFWGTEETKLTIRGLRSVDAPANLDSGTMYRTWRGSHEDKTGTYQTRPKEVVSPRSSMV